ncbi:MAG TPA: CPBP family intramembrane glutamic endopeptidase [Thermoanaerobaculia bacterium]
MSSVLRYVLLCFAISWSVWFAIPLAAHGNWSLMKVLIGIGLGPGLAAVLLARGRVSWPHFAVVALIVAALSVSILLTGDALTAADFRHVQPPGLTAIGILGSIAAACVCGAIAGCSRPNRAPLRWSLYALLLPAAIALVALLIARVNGERVEPLAQGLPRATWLWYSLRAALFTFVVVGIGEETGWRGYLLPRLQSRFSPLNASLITGVLWALWHFPLFVIGAYPGGPERILEYLFIAPILSLLFTAVYNRSGGALLPCIALHTAINNTTRFVPETSYYAPLLIVTIVAITIKDRMWRKRVNAAAAMRVEAV